VSRVFLIRPSSTVAAEAFVSEHLGLAAVAAALRASGHQVFLHDMTLENGGDPLLFERLGAFDPQLVGVTVTDAPMLEGTLRLRRQALNVDSAVPWVLGGYFPTFHAEEILVREPLIDAIILGEGDLTAYARRDSGDRPVARRARSG